MNKIIKREMAHELFYLWDNIELYQFVYGKENIKDYERQICKQIVNNEDRDDFIEDCSLFWVCNDRHAYD